MSAAGTATASRRRQVPELDAERHPGDLRRRLAFAGGSAAVLVVWWMVTEGSWNLFRRELHPDLFDAQAHAWLGGHWWIPANVAGIEGIVVDGRSQIYFGPWPALLRLPVAVFSHALDSRLAALSILAGAATCAWAAVRLLGQVRRLRRPGTAPTLADAIAAGAVAFVVPTGTTLLFVANRALVYDEAITWGVALSLVACSFVVDAADEPTTGRVVLAGAAATAAISARASVGLGPVVALGILAAVVTLRQRRPAWPIGLAAAVPLAAGAAVDLARFGTLASIPFRDQVQTALDPARKLFFAAHDGLFSVQFLPATIGTYLAPAGIRLSASFPFVDFPTVSGPVRAGVRFSAIEPAASAPATMPALVVLALVGVVVLARRGAPIPLRVTVTGAAVGGALVFVFGAISQRYLADLVPFLVIAALVGLDTVLAWRGGPARRWTLAGLAGLAVFGIGANAGLGLLQQGAWGSDIPPSAIARFLDLRQSAADLLGGPSPVVHHVRAGARLPRRAEAGDLAVVGDCDGLYFFSAAARDFLAPSPWRAVAETARAGSRSLRVRVAPQPAGASTPVLAIGDRDPGLLALEHVADDRVRVVWDGPPARAASTPFRLATGVHTVDVVADPYIHLVRVTVDGELRLQAYFGADGSTTTTGPGVRRRHPPGDTALCRRLVDASAR